MTVFEALIGAIGNTLNGSALQDFQVFLSKLPAETKWLIASDYCIGDKNKKNDTAVFTVIPYYDTFESIQADIKSIAQKDIKNTNTIKNEYLQYNSSGIIFHFCFLIGRSSGHPLTMVNKASIVEWLNSSLLQTLERRKTQASEEMHDYYNGVIRKVKCLCQDVKSQSFNMSLMRNILLFSTIAAQIGSLLASERQIEIIGWFSDRDNITNYCDGIVFDLFGMFHHELCVLHEIDDSSIMLTLAIEADSQAKRMWYDEIIRLPDYIAGTIADWDLSTNNVSKEKFITIIEGCIADNDHIALLRLSSKSGSIMCNRIVVNNCSTI
jgi:hypothetical protein